MDGAKVLIVDDVADTGRSLKLVYETLAKQAKMVKTTTLYCKYWSAIKPDYFAEETDAWIIFPWELHETVKKLGVRLLGEGRTVNGIEVELIKTGMSPGIVKRFVDETFRGERRGENSSRPLSGK